MAHKFGQMDEILLAVIDKILVKTICSSKTHCKLSLQQLHYKLSGGTSPMIVNWKFRSWQFWITLYLVLSGATVAGSEKSVVAQIVPDRTLGEESSRVMPLNGQTERIDGGATRGSNLFHSFQEFNINEGKGAYFANPAVIENIFSRVTGSNPSHLLGTLGVLGDANLFFLNPNGIIFGPNASLDLRGSLVSSTANSLLFPDGHQFSATNPEAAPLLTIDVPVPIGLQFEGEEPGAIINAGDLEVGANLTLVGGTVVSTGQLLTSEGEVAVSTVSGVDADGNLAVVQLGESGQILGQEFQPLAGANIQSDTSALSWSELVADGGDETGLTVNGQGTVELTQSGTTVSVGDIALGQLIAQGAKLSANHNLTLVESQLGTVGDLTLLAQDTVRLRDSVDHPLIAAAGGELLVQGNQGVDILALNHPDSGLFSGGDLVLRSANPVGGDAHYWSGGDFRIERLDEGLGDLFSLYDPIIRSQGDVSFFGYQGTSLHILAGGSVNINTAIITGTDTVGDTINPTATPSLATIPNVTLPDGSPLVIDGSTRPTLDVRAGIDPTVIGSPLGTSGENFPDVFFDSSFFPVPPPVNNPVATSADIKIDFIGMFGAGAADGVVFLTNQYQDNKSLPGGAINVGVIRTDDQFGRFSGNGGSVILNSRSDIKITDSLVSSSASGDGGNITLIANDAVSLVNNNISASTRGRGNAGNVAIQAGGSVFLENGNIFSNVERGAVGNGGDISITAESLSLVEGSQLQTLVRGASELFPGGRGDAGNVNINVRGAASLSGNGTGIFNTIGTGAVGNGGSIEIRAGSLSLREGARVDAITFGQGNAGNISVQVDEAVSLSDFSSINSEVFLNAIGNAGEINIRAGSLSLTNGASLIANTRGKGNAGNISVQADETVSLSGNGTLIQTSAGFETNVNSGNIDIRAGSLFVTDGTRLSTSFFAEGGKAGNISLWVDETVSLFGGSLSSNTDSSSIGKGGNINIRANSLSLNNGFVSTDTAGRGNAGNISVQVDKMISVSDSFVSSSVSGEETVGNGGEINIQAGSLSLTDGTLLFTNTAGRGNAGNISVQVDETISLSGIITQINSQVFSTAVGNGGEIKIRGDTLSLTDGASLDAETDGIGNAGNISVQVNEAVSLSDFSSINSEVFLNAVGKGGEIKIRAGSLYLTDRASLTTSTSGEGDAGRVNVDVSDRVSLQGSSEISAFTSGSGRAGSLKINAPNSVKITGTGGLLVQATNGGTAGNLTLETGELTLAEGASVTVSSENGLAGNVNITADSLFQNDGHITAETGLTDEEGANINLKISDIWRIENESLVSATALGDADGGNINIDTKFILAFPPTGLQGSDIKADAFEGNGGRIEGTTAGTFGIKFRDQPTPLNDFTVSSEFGLPGEFAVEDLGIDPTRGLIILPEETVNTEISQGCQTVRGREAVEYFEIGRGGLSSTPDEPLNADTVLEDWIDLEPKSDNGSDSGTTIHSPHSVKTQLISPCPAQ